MRVINYFRLGDLIGTLYKTTLKGETYYVYRIRFHKKIVGRSSVYFDNLGDCLDHMRSDMEQIFDSGKLENDK